MLTISNLDAGYQDLHVLKDISLEIEPGGITVLMGPNGAGKSTLLKAIFNLVHKSSGSISFLDSDITHLPTYSLLELGLAYVTQGKINFDTLTVEENLRMGAYHIEDPEIVQHNLAQVYTEFPILKRKKKSLAFSLSGGQQQTLAIGRALMNLPKLMLLDEPSLGLSPKLVTQLFATLKHINRHFDTTMVIVEHNLKSALNIADFGVVMVNGEIKAHQTSQKLAKSDILSEVFVGTIE